MTEINEEIILLTKQNHVEDKQSLVNAIKLISSASENPEYLEFWISSLLNFSTKEARTISFSVLFNWIKNRWDLFPETLLNSLIDVVFEKFYFHQDFNDSSFKFSLSKLQSYILFHNIDLFTPYLENIENTDFYSFYLMILNFNAIIEDNVYGEEKTKIVLIQLIEKDFAQKLLEYCYSKYTESVLHSNECFSLLFKFLPASILFNDSMIEVLNFILTKDFKTGISILNNIMNRNMNFMKPSDEEKMQIINLFPILSLEINLEIMDLDTLLNLSLYIKLYLTPVLDFSVSSSFYDLSVALLETNNCSIVDNILFYLDSLIQSNPEIFGQIEELCIQKLSDIINYSPSTDNKTVERLPDIDLLMEKYLNQLSLIAKISKDSFLSIIKTFLENINESTEMNVYASLLSSIEIFISNIKDTPIEFIEYIHDNFLFLLQIDEPFEFSYIISLSSYSAILQSYFETYGDEFITTIFLQCSKVALSINQNEEEQNIFIDTFAMEKLYEQISFIATNFSSLFAQNEEIIMYITQFVATKKKNLIYSMCKIINKIEIDAKQSIFAECLQLFINDEEFNSDVENTLDFIKEIDISNCNDLQEGLSEYFISIQDHIFNQDFKTIDDSSDRIHNNITYLYLTALFNALGINSFSIISSHLNEIVDEFSLTAIIENFSKNSQEIIEKDPNFSIQFLNFVMEKTQSYVLSPARADEMPDEEETNDNLVSLSTKLLITSFPLLPNEEFQRQVLIYVINAMNSFRIKDKNTFKQCALFVSSLISQETMEIIESIGNLFVNIMSTAISSSKLNSMNKMQLLECSNIIRKMHLIDPDESTRFSSMIMEKIGANQDLYECFCNFLFNDDFQASNFIMMLKGQ